MERLQTSQPRHQIAQLLGGEFLFQLMPIAGEHLFERRRTAIVKKWSAVNDAAKRGRVEPGIPGFVGKADIVSLVGRIGRWGMARLAIVIVKDLSPTLNG